MLKSKRGTHSLQQQLSRRSHLKLTCSFRKPSQEQTDLWKHRSSGHLTHRNSCLAASSTFKSQRGHYVIIHADNVTVKWTHTVTKTRSSSLTSHSQSSETSRWMNICRCQTVDDHVAPSLQGAVFLCVEFLLLFLSHLDSLNNWTSCLRVTNNTLFVAGAGPEDEVRFTRSLSEHPWIIVDVFQLLLFFRLFIEQIWHHEKNLLSGRINDELKLAVIERQIPKTFFIFIPYDIKILITATLKRLLITTWRVLSHSLVRTNGKNQEARLSSSRLWVKGHSAVLLSEAALWQSRIP